MVALSLGRGVLVCVPLVVLMGSIYLLISWFGVVLFACIVIQSRWPGHALLSERYDAAGCMITLFIFPEFTFVFRGGSVVAHNETMYRARNMSAGLTLSP